MDNNNNYNNYNNQGYQQYPNQQYQQYPNQQYPNQQYQQYPNQQYPNQQYQQYSNQATQVSQKSELIAFLLWWFLGGLGIHRFYVGKIGTGVIWLLTCGCFGIGNIVDFVNFFKGTFTDKSGMTLKLDCPKGLKIAALVIWILAVVAIVLSFGAILAAITAIFASM